MYSRKFHFLPCAPYIPQLGRVVHTIDRSITMISLWCRPREKPQLTMKNEKKRCRKFSMKFPFMNFYWRCKLSTTLPQLYLLEYRISLRSCGMWRHGALVWALYDARAGAVVSIINSGTSKDPSAMCLMCCLHFISICSSLQFICHSRCYLPQ